MTFETQWLTNNAYGYPVDGAERRIGSTHLMCIHITANPSKPPATAQQERNYANRADSSGPSAHDYIDRDGDGIHAINPGLYAAWSNGVLRSPKTSVPGVAAVVASKAAGFNPNECYYREVECCGKNPEYPITPPQAKTLARLIAADSLDTGIPISRASVHLHSDLDSVSRPNDPVPAVSAEAFVAAIIEEAICIKTTSELGIALLKITELEARVNVLADAISTMHGEMAVMAGRLVRAGEKITAATLLLENGTEYRAHAILTEETE